MDFCIISRPPRWDNVLNCLLTGIIWNEMVSIFTLNIEKIRYTNLESSSYFVVVVQAQWSIGWVFHHIIEHYLPTYFVLKIHFIISVLLILLGTRRWDEEEFCKFLLVQWNEFFILHEIYYYLFIYYYYYYLPLFGGLGNSNNSIWLYVNLSKKICLQFWAIGIEKSTKVTSLGMKTPNLFIFIFKWQYFSQ